MEGIRDPHVSDFSVFFPEIYLNNSVTCLTDKFPGKMFASKCLSVATFP